MSSNYHFYEGSILLKKAVGFNRQETATMTKVKVFKQTVKEVTFYKLFLFITLKSKENCLMHQTLYLFVLIGIYCLLLITVVVVNFVIEERDIAPFVWCVFQLQIASSSLIDTNKLKLFLIASFQLFISITIL